MTNEGGITESQARKLLQRRPVFLGVDATLRLVPLLAFLRSTLKMTPSEVSDAVLGVESLHQTIMFCSFACALSLAVHGGLRSSQTVRCQDCRPRFSVFSCDELLRAPRR
jgi:hypothetical protein